MASPVEQFSRYVRSTTDSVMFAEARGSGSGQLQLAIGARRFDRSRGDQPSCVVWPIDTGTTATVADTASALVTSPRQATVADPEDHRCYLLELHCFHRRYLHRVVKVSRRTKLVESQAPEGAAVLLQRVIGQQNGFAARP